MTSTQSNWITCGCCEGQKKPAPVYNEPGLPALRYRVGTYSTFFQRMLRALSLTSPDPQAPNEKRPLAALSTRSTDDPTIGLIDAVSCVADVLTFYQERIANEGFLRTATERRSVLEMANSIGYQLAPGVAAGVYLSFTVENAAGAPSACFLAAGTQVQSVPAQDESPQVFETSADFRAQAAWNALRPRLTHPARLAIYVEETSPESLSLVLLAPTGLLSGEGRITEVDGEELYRLDSRETPAEGIDAQRIDHIYVREDTAPSSKGELLLFVGKYRDSMKTLVMRVSEITAEPDHKRVKVGLEHLEDPGKNTDSTNVIGVTTRANAAAYAKPGVKISIFSTSEVSSNITQKKWQERDLQAYLAIQRWSASELTKTINTKSSGSIPLSDDPGAFAFRERLGFFGHNAPKWASLPNDTNTNGDPYPKGWDPGDTNNVETLPRTIWQNSQGASLQGLTPLIHAYLERNVTSLTRDSWVLVTYPEEKPKAYRVLESWDVSRADYGLSGRAMGLRLSDQDNEEIDSDNEPHFSFRATTAHAASRRLSFVDLPIATPVENTNRIELDQMVLGLFVGQAVALTGERSDATGVIASEIAILSAIEHSDGRTTLVLTEDLRYSYVRDKLRINANTVPATHGETVNELLGSGDAAAANQCFTLKKSPLTYVSAPTVSGTKSSLEVRVNGVLWAEVPSLYGKGPTAEVFIVRIDDNAVARVQFGDGIQGARLPTGSANVAATYRSGIGPGGEVAAGSLTILRMIPLGLRGVTNLLKAGGSEGPESLSNARVNAPLTVLTFDRVVSLADFENYARRYPGIGKARADVLWAGGGNLIHITVASATGGAIDQTLRDSLIASIRGVSDFSQRFEVTTFAQRYFGCEANLVIDPRYVSESVVERATAHLQESFAFENRAFAQSVTGAEVIKLIHEVEGVLAVDLNALIPYDDTFEPESANAHELAVPAWPASVDPDGEIQAAQLVLINPVGILLRELQS